MSNDPYSSIVTVRNAEMAAHWTRYNIQIVLNSTILFGYLAAKERGFADAAAPLVIVLGSLFSALWAVLNWRGHFWLRFWNERLAHLEVTESRADVFSEAIVVSQESGLTRIALLAALVPSSFAVAWWWLAQQSVATVQTFRLLGPSAAIAVCAAVLVLHLTSRPISKVFSDASTK